MFKRLILPATVLVFASACHSESAGPPFVDEPVSLNLGLPQFRQLSDAQPREADAPPAPPSAAQFALFQSSGEELPSAFQQVVDLGSLMDHPAQAEAGFVAEEGIAYGQALGTSFGSYYKNAVHLRIFKNGSQVGERFEDETESCNCVHYPNSWGKTANVTIAVDEACGLKASAYAKHVARLDFSTGSGKTFNLLSDSDAGSHHKPQDACTPPKTGGGNNGQEGEEWFICFWEDFYSALGEFTHRINLGCEPLNAQ